MKGTKRLLAWLLAIAMIVSTVQTNVVTAYADTTDGTPIEQTVDDNVAQSVTVEDATDEVETPPADTKEDEGTTEDAATPEDPDDDADEVVTPATPEDKDSEEEPDEIVATPEETKEDAKDTGTKVDVYEVEEEPSAIAEDSYNLAEICKTLSAHLYKGENANDKSQEISSPFTLTYGDAVFLALQFVIPNDVLKDVKAASNRTSIEFYYDFGSDIDFTFNKETDQPLEYNGRQIGTYTIDGKRFSFKLNEAFFELNMNELEGWANLFAKLNKNHGIQEGTTEHTWKFPGNVTYTGKVQEDTSKWKVEISKDTTDYNTSSLTNRGFKITVKSTGSNTGVKVTDTLGQYLTLVVPEGGSAKDGFTIVKKDGSTKKESTVTDYTVTGSGTTEDPYVIALPDMADGDQYTINYSVDVNPDALNGNSNYTNVQGKGSDDGTGVGNSAKVTYTPEGGEEKTSDPKNKGVTVYKQWLDKSGSYDSASGEITWTVTLNAGGANSDLSGMTIRDTYDTTKMTYVAGSMTLDSTLAGLSGLNWDNLFTEAGVTLPEDSNLTGTYKITYRTKLTETELANLKTTQATYSNKAEIKPGDDWIDTTGYVSAGTNHEYIQKQCNTEAGSSTRVKWTVTVNVPAGYDINDGTEVTDQLPKGMTLDRSTVQIGGAQVAENDIKTVAAANEWQGEKFSLTLPIKADADTHTTDAAQTFVITYETTIDESAQGSDNWFQNSATFVKTASATYNYKKSNEAPTATKSVSDDGKKTGVITWKVTIKDSSMIGLNSQSLKLIDTLPANTEYVEGSATLWTYSTSKYKMVETDAGITASVEDGVLTLDASSAISYFRDQTDDSWNIPYITFQTKITNLRDLDWKQQIQITNKAKWELDDVEGDETSADLWFQNQVKVFDKSGKDIGAGRVSYTIKVNENELTVNGGSDLTLIDKMGTGIDYTMGSMEVTYYDEEQGAEVTVPWSGADKVSYDADNHILTIMGLKDAKSYVITYSATNNLEDGTKYTKENGGNTVWLSGSDSQSLSDTTTLDGKSSRSNAGVTVKGKSLQIYKYGDEDGSSPLRGAQFKIYEVSYDKDTQTIGETPDAEKYLITTLSDGYATATGLETDTLYLIKETKAPTGYVISDEYADGVYFAFLGSQGEESESYNWPSNVKVYNADVKMPKININNDSESDSSVKVLFAKVDSDVNPLAGAELQLIDSTQNVVKSWTSGSGPVELSLEPDTYTLIETKAPKGYDTATSITFTVNEDGSIAAVNAADNDKVASTTSEEDGTITNTVTMTDDESKLEVKISKQDIAGAEIAGAQLAIYKADDTEKANAVDNWTSEAGKTHTASLEAGNYVLVETLQPDGYKVASDIAFTVTKNDDGTVTVTVNGESVDKVVMTDDYANQLVKISKQQITEGVSSPLSGASLVIKDASGQQASVYDANGDAVAQPLTSGEDALQVYLAPGTYTLEETAAPDGYAIATTITFTVKMDGSVENEGNMIGDTLVMIDKAKQHNEIKISKADINGKEIDGAEMVILDENGNEVESWTSSSAAAHVVDIKDGTYYLVERVAPAGYEKVETRIQFTVTTTENPDDTKTVSVTSDTTDAVIAPSGDETLYTVRMTDNYSGTTLKISKTDIAGKELEGAYLTLYKGDANSTEVAEDFKTGESLQNHKSEKNNWVVSLAPGTYTLVEDQAPAGYEKSEKITFTLAADGTVTLAANSTGEVDEFGVLTMTDDYSKYDVEISKRIVNGTDELPGAQLQIVKMQSDGKTVDETFEAIEWTSGMEAHTVQLQPGTYKLIETKAPDDYEQAESILFTVDKTGKVDNATPSTDEQGNTTYTVVMEDKEKAPEQQEVKISKRAVTLTLTGEVSQELAGATLIVTNKASGKEVARFVTDGSEHSIYVEPGTYILTEDAAPTGYDKAESIEFTVDRKGNITSPKKDATGAETGESNLQAGVLVMVDDHSDYTVTLSKQDVQGVEIAGATLRLQSTDKDGHPTTDDIGNVVDLTHTSVAGSDGTVSPWRVKLYPGTYTLTETQVPEGSNYEQAEAITFTLNADGSITGLDGRTVVMTDEYKKVTVKIVKEDQDHNKVPGASLTLTGTTLGGDPYSQSWLTDTATDTSYQLEPGSYILTEVTAPDGYEQATNITIDIDKDGKVKIDGKEQQTTDVYTVTMTDIKKTKPYDLNISKQDLAGKEIQGAVLTVTGEEKSAYGADEDKEIAQIEWTSDGKSANKISLNPGEYYLTETTAPNGYVKAEQIKFTLVKDENDNYKVTSYVKNESGEWVESDKFKDGRLVMTDDYTTHEVSLSKQDVIGAEIDGAEMELIGYVNGSNEEVHETWTSGRDADNNRITTPHTFQLKPGTYTLKEKAVAKDKDRNPLYEIATDIEFSVDVNGKVTLLGKNGTVKTSTTTDKETGTTTTSYTVIMTDEWVNHKVSISKRDIAGEEIEGANITITGTTADGKTITPITWTSGVDGKDEDGKIKPHEIELQPGTYTMTENTAPDGYEKAESITFTVKTDGTIKIENDVVTGIAMTDEYAERTIKISKRNIANDKEVTGAQLTILDQDGNTIEPTWTSESGQDHEVTYKWEIGKKYILKEIKAASGYKLTSEIIFYVDALGNVTVDENVVKIDGKDGAVVDADGVLVLYNQLRPSDDGGNGGDDGGDNGGDEPSTTPKTTSVGLSVALVKIDSTTGLALAGATFDLYTKDGVKIGTYTTDEYGIIRVDGLDLGDYYFVEVSAPAGYIISSWQQVFTLDRTNTTKNPEIVSVANTPENTVTPGDSGEGIGAGGDNGALNGDGAGAAGDVGGATGDNSMMTTYGIVAGLAAAALVLWFVARRKRENF